MGNNKGYSNTSNTGSSIKQVLGQAMKAGKPKTKNQQGIAGIPTIPSVRPTTMRNLTPWNGWVKPGK